MRFARKAGIDDAALCAAVGQIKRGLYAANLGGGVVKHRIARRGQGKSGGFRVLIVFEAGASAFFVHGFAKNEKGDIRRDELLALKKLASELLAYDDNAIARAVNSGALIEVFCDEKTIS
ncbi:MAG: type II toxin-antitoxin system RelE/ParE family toxin [Acidobacteriaceae bacterium]|nr:type II toxin-antitoxin system RelE/ParE family toxin [Acidobacteriaceae bacterium]MBV9778698.1 type II toxin-antitoxin system RelE/ParE family toxin [Acidobacteriaceae bacterium]